MGIQATGGSILILSWHGQTPLQALIGGPKIGPDHREVSPRLGGCSA
jgi:hypothetical protein